jgi:deoxyribonuclease V
VTLSWPVSADDLIREQQRLAALSPPLWRMGAEVDVGGCFVCFPRGYEGEGAAGDPAWVAAVVVRGGQPVAHVVIRTRAAAPYRRGLLALREGPALEEALRALPRVPDVLLVNASGRDHPRRAGLAVHLGARLDLPTVGVTDRPLVASGPWPGPDRGATSPLRVGDEVVAYWVRTQPGVRPVVAHAAWRTDPQTAVQVVLHTATVARTPEPLRLARRLARAARAADGGGRWLPRTSC